MKEVNIHNFIFGDGKIYPWPRPIQATIDFLRVLVQGTDGTPPAKPPVEKQSSKTKK